MERSETSSTNGISRTSGSSASLSAGMESTKTTGDQLRAGAREATDKVLSSASKAAETIGEQTRKLRDGQMHLGESCRAHLREKPFSTLGIAVATGFVLALLLKRK